MREKKCGVYQIRNTSSGMVYIGSTSDLYKRLSTHRLRLRLGRHKNTRLQTDYDLNPDTWDYQILELCSADDRLVREQYYLSLHFGPNCYNCKRVAIPAAEGSRHSAKRMAKSKQSKLLSAAAVREIRLLGADSWDHW